MGCDGFQWVKMGFHELRKGWNGLEWVGMGSNGLERVATGFTGLKIGETMGFTGLE